MGLSPKMSHLRGYLTAWINQIFNDFHFCPKKRTSVRVGISTSCEFPPLFIVLRRNCCGVLSFVVRVLRCMRCIPQSCLRLSRLSDRIAWWSWYLAPDRVGLVNTTEFVTSWRSGRWLLSLVSALWKPRACSNPQLVYQSHRNIATFNSLEKHSHASHRHMVNVGRTLILRQIAAVDIKSFD